MYSPLEQFEVSPVKGLFYFFDYAGISVTNFTVSAVFAVMLLLTLFLLGIFDAQFLATPGQYFLEFLYGFIYGLFLSNLSDEEHMYFPYVFSLFVLILTYNLLGLFPYGYTITSQIIIAALFSFSTFTGLLWIGISRHGFDFIGIFFPPEAPALLSFLLVPIEIVSFFSRPFSLAIRLFANMTAGHVLLKILSGFAVVLFSSIIGLNFNFIYIFYWLANGFNEFNFTYYPDLADYYLSVSALNVSYACYNIKLFSLNVLSYYSQLFHIEDLLENSIGTKSFWLTIRWRLLLYANYLAPVVIPEAIKKSMQFTSEFISVITPTPQQRMLILLGYCPFLYYIHNPQIFYNSLLTCDWALLSATSNNLFTVALVGVTQILNFMSWLLVACIAIILPLALISFFIILELFVSVLQAYVFTILIVIYLRDVIELH